MLMVLFGVLCLSKVNYIKTLKNKGRCNIICNSYNIITLVFLLKLFLIITIYSFIAMEVNYFYAITMHLFNNIPESIFVYFIGTEVLLLYYNDPFILYSNDITYRFELCNFTINSYHKFIYDKHLRVA